MSLEQLDADHPNRRAHNGPSDVEWALLVQKVDGLGDDVKVLTTEVKKFAEFAVMRCDSCKNVPILKDHENRIREVEQMVWKAIGAVALGTTLLSYLLNQLFK